MDLDKAEEVIREGGIVIFPTETAYGLAADATNEDAVEKIYELKNRPRSKGLTIIIDSMDKAFEYGDLKDDEVDVMDGLMPGPLTLVTEKPDDSKLAENVNDDFVFRISPDEVAQKLSNNVPITATSANISGKATSYAVEDISESIRENVDYIVDKGRLPDRPTSSIVEISDGDVLVHRRGPIKKKEVENVL